MRFARRMLPGGVLSVLVACGSDGVTEPGALTITLNGPPPSVTNAAAFPMSGQVTRTPAAADQVIVVTATGGVSAVSDTAAADGSFGFTVTLAPNAQNSLSISATDQSGSASTPVMHSVRHDNQPPQVSSMTPASGSDGVTPATIQLVFDEPVVPGSPTVQVAVYGTGVPGSAESSADSLTLTFTPSAPLAANAVHVVNVTGSRDALGNVLGSGGGCFVTGGAGISVFADTGGFYQYGTPSGLVPPDLRELRWARTTSTLHGILQFDAPRTLDPTAANNTSVWMDLDVDQDGGTGFVTFKDFVFAGVLPSSGAASEFFIELGTLLDGADAVAMYTARDTAQGTLEFTVTSQLTPGTCGAVFGFAIPFSAIGGDDGAFDVTLYVDVFRGDAPSGSGIIDPAPDEGVFSAALTAVAGTSAGAAVRVSDPQHFDYVTRRRPGAIRRR